MVALFAPTFKTTPRTTKGEITMAHKVPRVECKFYLRPEERDHLKQVALEKEVSLSDLIGTTLLKKYPMEKKKARSVNLASTVANCISSELPEQVQLDEPLPEKTESLVDESVPQDVDSIKEKESRLREVNRLLNLAKKGDRLERDVYFSLVEEQKTLRASLGHN